MKRAITTLTAALLGAAGAQEISTSLPLTSVGQKLMWTVGDQDLKLIVGVSSRVQLDIYGAQFDPQDYRKPDEFGDENYSTQRPKASVTSTFELTDAAGKVVKTFNYGVGAQDWQTFLNADLSAGTYTLKVRTEGKGKNTFAFRLNSISAAVQADHLNVTIRSNDWVPALNVYNPGGQLSVKMYDGDGPSELQAELRDAAGNVHPIKVSGQLQWNDINVPEAKGNYTIYLRQPKNSYQFSNTVGFELTSGPITVVQADTTGKLDIKATLVLPDESLPTQANVTVGQQTYNVQGSAGPWTLPAQNYPVTVEPIKGAEVTVDQSQVAVVKQQTAHVAVQVKPTVDLQFSADKSEVCVGDVVKFTAQANTAFERQLIPANLRVTLPTGFSANGATSVAAKVDAHTPGLLTFEARAEAAGGGQFVATLAPWNKTQQVAVNVLPSATQIELRRAELPPTLAGETVTVSLSLKNTSGAVAPYSLTDSPGETLEALDPTTFSGELQPGESKTLTYHARVKGDAGAQGTLKATLTSNCESSQTVAGVLSVQAPPPPPPAPVVSITRESTVRIPFDSPKAAIQIVIAHQAPEGSTYVPGSSTLNGKPIDDPQIGKSGKFYWTTPGTQRGVLTYRVNHEGALPALNSPALIGKYAKNTLEVLVGDASNLTELQSLQTMQPSDDVTENNGAVKLPVAGTVFRERDRITLAVEGKADDAALPTVNGVAVSAATMGRQVIDNTKGTQRREFFGVPLHAGTNEVSYAGETVKVFLAGTPVTAQLTPEQLIADGSTPIRIGLKLLDAYGLTNGSTVTVQTNSEVTQQDARPRVGSYQVKLINGVGVLEIEPMSTPTRFDVNVLVGDKTVHRSFESLPSKTRVGIGMVSAGILLSGGGQNTSAVAGELRGSGYLETPVGDGKLYVAGSAATTAEAANGQINFTQDKTQGLPSSNNPLERYPTYGDSSVHEIPLEGIDPLAFRYEHPKFSLQYRQAQLPVDVFDTGLSPTALSGFTRSNPQVSAFVAGVPADLVHKILNPNGLRVVSLGLTAGSVQADSETVELMTVSPTTGVTTYRTLQRLVDYTIDNAAGILYFQKAINLIDENGNAQRIRVSYRTDNPNDARELAWGVQVGTRLLDDRLTVAAALVHVDDVNSFGVRARYLDESSHADLLVAYSGAGTLVSGTANIATNRVTAEASIKYQSADYTGLNTVSVGTAIDAKATYKITDRFGVGVAGFYNHLPDASNNGVDEKNGGYVDLQGLYTFAPFTVGAGVRTGFGDLGGFGLIGSLGYNKNNVNVQVEHAASLGGDVPSTTTLTASIPVRENVSFIARDDMRWGVDNRASMGLQARYGMTNIAVNYDLPGADGWGNRARFGVDTSLPVGDRLTFGVTGSYVKDMQGDTTGWNAGGSVRYKDDRTVATLATDVSQISDGTHWSVRGGAAYTVNDRLTLSFDGTHVTGPQDTDTGNNFAVSAALRASQWQGLAYLRYKNGALGGDDPELTGEANLEYHVPRYALRGGIAGRELLSQTDSLTYQVSASGTYFINDRFGLGLAARALIQPATDYRGYSFGFEGSVRALPGTWVTLGYNPVGFTGIGSNIYTRQGAYLRLDMMLDDQQANGANVAATQLALSPDALGKINTPAGGSLAQNVPTTEGNK